MSPPALNLNCFRKGKDQREAWEEQRGSGRTDHQAVNSGLALPDVENTNTSTGW